MALIILLRVALFSLILDQLEKKSTAPLPTNTSNGGTAENVAGPSEKANSPQKGEFRCLILPLCCILSLKTVSVQAERLCRGPAAFTYLTLTAEWSQGKKRRESH